MGYSLDCFLLRVTGTQARVAQFCEGVNFYYIKWSQKVASPGVQLHCASRDQLLTFCSSILTMWFLSLCLFHGSRMVALPPTFVSAPVRRKGRVKGKNVSAKELKGLWPRHYLTIPICISLARAVSYGHLSPSHWLGLCHMATYPSHWLRLCHGNLSISLARALSHGYLWLQGVRE